ncbi:MAG: phosphate signaling complex protein PhoU [Gemmatimonadetes bacterium]|nr:phosphate signaling complex protein PhoU [Gemmatimonadota bacterium]
MMDGAGTTDSENTAVRRHFHDELDQLQVRLMAMAGLVEQLVVKATRAVLELDIELGEQVGVEDDAVDELELELDDRVVRLLALHQPMAVDLRQIVATSKVVNDLERMGDHAVNVGRAATHLARRTPLPEVREIEEMVAIVREMVSDALAAYVSRNVVTARMVCITDRKVNDLRNSLQRILISYMLENPKSISAALEMLFVSQNLERIADLATNISEDVVFLVEGRSIKHGADHAEGDDEGHGSGASAAS